MGLSRTEINAGNAQILTEHARRLVPVGYIWDKVFPKLMKPGLENGAITNYDDAAMRVPDDAKRPVGGKAAQRDDSHIAPVTWNTTTYAHKVLWTQREQNQWDANGNNPEMLKFVKTSVLVNQMQLLIENTLATKLISTSNYETGYSTSIGSGSVWTVDASTPISDIETGIKKVESGGVFPNKFICGNSVWRTIQMHSDLLSLMKYTKAGRISEADFQTIFGLEPIIGKAVKDADGTKSEVWDDVAIIAYIKDGMDENSPESDMTFGRTIMSSDFRVRDYETKDEDFDKAVWIEVEVGFTCEYIGIDNTSDKDTVSAYLIDNAI